MKTHWPSPSLLNLSPHQREELAKAFRGRVGILSGKPGCGKTYTIGELVRYLESVYGSYQIGIAAPTGKAAQRVNQFLSEKNLESRACTIHRLLGVTRAGYDGKGWRFAHDAMNPLPYRFIIISEGSMPDTDIMASLFAAIPYGTHVLIEGDCGQLAPVGHGAPMRDLIAAGVPYGELSEIRRQGAGSQIVQACSDIRDGKPWDVSPRISEANGMDLILLQAGKPAESVETLKRFILNAPKSIDPIWDIQVLVAVNAKSELARKPLNTFLQSLLNPGGKQVSGCRFREGDKIICTKNTLLEMSELNGKSVSPTDEFIANGELGMVRKIEESGKVMYVEFPEPDRLVKVLMGKPAKSQAANVSGAASDDEDSGGSGCDFDLGYASTVHRAQGSQWPVVIMVLDDYPGAKMVASRELVYTGLSRAQRLCVLLGKKSTADLWCRKVALTGRKTFLAEEIKDGIRESMVKA